MLAMRGVRPIGGEVAGRVGVWQTTAAEVVDVEVGVAVGEPRADARVAAVGDVAMMVPFGNEDVAFVRLHAETWAASVE